MFQYFAPQLCGNYDLQVPLKEKKIITTMITPLLQEHCFDDANFERLLQRTAEEILSMTGKPQENAVQQTFFNSCTHESAKSKIDKLS